uniref:Uncharacterized protein n=1 Tax=Timema bartmani TaxID=61472 RepID=A0A7R9HZJ7_9NEOP|nr:unnamed protein product [Timema bartmani]
MKYDEEITENRGGSRESEYDRKLNQELLDHINTFRCRESHYGRLHTPGINIFLPIFHAERRNVSISNQAVKLQLESEGPVSCLTEITTSRTCQRYIRNGEETTDCGGYGLHENLAHALQLCLLGK